MTERLDAVLDRWAAEIRNGQRHNHLLRMPETLPVVRLDLEDAATAEAVSALVGGTMAELALTGEMVDAQVLEKVEVLDRRHRSERGVDALRLGLGVVEHPDRAGGIRAPLVVVDVALVRRGRFRDARLVLTGGAELNPVLVALGLIDDVPIAPLDDWSDDLPGRLDRLARAALPPELGDQATVGHEALVAAFALPRMATLAELEARPACYAESTVLRALAGDPDAIDDVNAPRRHARSDVHPRLRLDLPLQADSSQVRAIDGVTGRLATCIEGPPGTGKSQTIANLVATTVAQRQRVLLVCEKRAAVDAVVRRLTDAGCGSAVLDLHSTTTPTWELARGLLERLEAKPSADAPPLPGSGSPERVELMVRAFHVVIPELADTPFAIQEAVARAHLAAGPVPRTVIDAVALVDELVRTVDPRDSTLGDALSEYTRVDGPAMVSGDVLLGPLIRGEALATDVSADQLTSALPWASSVLTEAAAAWEQHAPGSSPTVAEVAAAAPAWASAADAAARWDDDVLAEPSRVTIADQGVAKRWRSGRDAAARQAIEELRASHRGGGLSGAELRRDARLLLASLDAVGLESPVARHHVERMARATAAVPQLVDVLGAFVPADEVGGLDVARLAASLQGLVAHPATVTRAAVAARSLAVIEAAGLAGAVEALADAMRTHGEASGRRHLEVLIAEARCRELYGLRPGLVRFDSAAFGPATELVASEDARRRAAATVDVLGAMRAARLESRSWGLSAQALQALAKDRSRRLGLRTLFDTAGEAALLAGPCVILSPTQVAEVLPPEALFDLLVFDEASQVRTSDAAPAIVRARSVVVVGDDRQLPPTTFFEAAADPEPDHIGADLLESVLDAVSVVTVAAEASHRLIWHYRSRDPRLIDFSNSAESLYRRTLFVPPSRTPDPTSLAHVVVEPGDDDAVAHAVVDHLRSHPDESTMVVVTSIAQAGALDTRVRELVTTIDDEELSRRLEDEGPEPFVVKNIERVQGDERDGVLVVLRGARAADGSLSHAFGSLGQSGGERRLNVAITRARSRMTVVTDFRAAEIDADRLTTTGGTVLSDFMRWVEQMVVPPADPTPVHDPLLARLDGELRPYGYQLAAPPTEGAHAASAVVLDRGGQPLMLLDHDRRDIAELDGVDLSVVRPTVLTDRGWETAMVWSTDIVRDVGGVAQGLLRRLDGRGAPR